MNQEIYSQPSPEGFEVINAHKVVARFATRHEADAHVRALKDFPKPHASPNISREWREID